MFSNISLYELTKAPTESCHDCPLGNVIVPYSSFNGSNVSPRIILVGESPGRSEIMEGKPFVGRAGQLLRHNVELAGLPTDHIFIANSARCIINKNELTSSEIRNVLRCCRSMLESTIRFLQPHLILALGEIAMRQILGLQGITQHRGKVYYSNEFRCGCMPLFHPAYILRDRPTREPVFLRDLKWAKMHVYVKPLDMHPTSL